MYEHLESCDPPEEDFDTVPSATEVPDALFFAVPADGTEPLLDAEQLSALDDVTDTFEMQRLEATRVLSLIDQCEVTDSDRLLQQSMSRA